MTKKLYFMRGLPGSGKSTTAKKLNGVICSADNFFMKNGKYEFNFDKLSEAHKECQNQTMEHIEKGTDIIIVDNTNIKLSELSAYKKHIILAQSKGYDIEIIEPDTEWAFDIDILFNTNTHGLSKTVLRRMKFNYEQTGKITVEDIINNTP